MGNVQSIIQTDSFKLLTKYFNHSLGKDELYDEVVKQLAILLQASHVRLYEFNVKSQEYKLISGTDIDVGEVKDLILSKDEVETFSVMQNEGSLVKLPLEIGTGKKMGLLIASEKKLENELLNSTINMVEILFDIVEKIYTLRKKNEQHQFLYKLSTELFSQNEKEKIFAFILEALETLYPDMEYSLFMAQYNGTDATLPIKSFKISEAGNFCLSTEAFMTGEFKMENIDEEGKTYMYAPLSGKQGTYGVLQMIVPISRFFSELELTFIQNFAGLAGNAIERVSLYENSNHQISSLSLINEFAKKLNQNLELSQITTLVKKEMLDLCQPDEIGFVYFNEKKLTDVLIQEESTAYFKTSKGMQFAKSLYEKISNEDEPIFSGKYQSDFSPYQSIMAIPMNHSNYSHGATIVMHKEMYYFTFETFKLAEALIQHAALAMTNALLKDHLHKAVITDYLTGIYSRNYLEKSIDKDMKHGKYGVLLLFDIDNFKRVNDNYGHHIGDKVIIQVAQVIRSIGRDSDIPARWGGEELALYMPNCSTKESLHVAELIRSRVSEVTKPHVTVSCGVSAWTIEENPSIINLFLRTDKALYEAKRTGKNRIVNK
ncbi:GGDEF domain-containing protein [Oceanobacillus piezotolerans]|uniref:GGDEF domain-containing protein n=1 Tax=Oceanobacillus piezotolerans TaxID=2448030 RepID=A0A498DA35_9BACI|nr:sensor domain-containing diguanylate cyclase [Oceanobacillus piezotolerans]RLL47841.1 GGDEF domain-containing protein [Oceanobacillus piezotolerans]